MAATIKTKIRTTTGGTASTTAGELCVNTFDKKIFIGDGAATVELANQIGYNTITTLGTISTGTWSATAIGATKGGTGQTTYAAGDLIYSSAADTLSKLTKPAATSVLSMTSGGVPSWNGITGTGSTVFGTSPSISTLEISTTTAGNYKYANINMATGVTATRNVSSTITLNAYDSDWLNLGGPVPFTKTGYISTTSAYELTLGGSSGNLIAIESSVIYIGDIDANNDGQMIAINSAGTIDITGTLNINGHNILPLSSVVTTAAALTNVSTAQNAFPVGQQTLTVAQDTTYLIEGQYNINCGTTTHTTAIGFTVAGDVMDVTGLEFSVVMWTGGGAITTTQSTYRVSANASTQTVLNATSTAAEATILITGIWKNTSNETITPKIKFSAAPGGTNTMGAGSYIRFTPIANPTNGPWV